MEKIRELLRRQDFYPGFLGLFTNPAYFARKGLLENIRHFSAQIKGRVLDVGCGTQPYRELFKNVEYVGLEIDTPKNRRNKNIDFFYDGNRLPFTDGEFDSVITTEVLGHVFNPDGFLQEIQRVLKANGALLLTTPFAWDENRQPYDYARYSSFGIAHLLEKSGFTIIEQRKSLADIRAIFQLSNNYLRKRIRIKNKHLKLLVYMALFGSLNILGSIFFEILPAHDDMYLHNVILARKQS
jgi:SAM-dependent methyltransferase